MFAGSGSARIAAQLVLARRGDQGVGVVPRHHDGLRQPCARGTPGLEGSACVASPEPACASRPSTWPW